MQVFEKEHKQFAAMLKRYDEVLSQKANKTSLIALEKKLYEKYARKEARDRRYGSIDDQIDSHTEQLAEVKQMID